MTQRGPEITTNGDSVASVYLACVNRALRYSDDKSRIAYFVSDMNKSDKTNSFLTYKAVEILRRLDGAELVKFITEFNVPGVHRVSIVETQLPKFGG